MQFYHYYVTETLFSIDSV